MRAWIPRNPTTTNRRLAKTSARYCVFRLTANFCSTILRSFGASLCPSPAGCEKRDAWPPSHAAFDSSKSLACIAGASSICAEGRAVREVC